MTGRILGSRYEIFDMIDSGGMAYIYKARCKKTNNVVAVKVLKENSLIAKSILTDSKRKRKLLFRSIIITL